MYLAGGISSQVANARVHPRGIALWTHRSAAVFPYAAADGQVSAAALPAMGMGWFFTTFAITLVPVVGIVIFIMMKGIRLHRRVHRSTDGVRC